MTDTDTHDLMAAGNQILDIVKTLPFSDALKVVASTYAAMIVGGRINPNAGAAGVIMAIEIALKAREGLDAEATKH